MVEGKLQQITTRKRFNLYLGVLGALFRAKHDASIDVFQRKCVVSHVHVQLGNLEQQPESRFRSIRVKGLAIV